MVLRKRRVTHAFITPAALASVDPSGLDDSSASWSAASPGRRNWWRTGCRSAGS
ncbi:hypothetical protein GS426_04105 [Rhodococcus hoagii]|nr:hypothetical protein [Prescottella equi]